MNCGNFHIWLPYTSKCVGVDAVVVVIAGLVALLTILVFAGFVVTITVRHSNSTQKASLQRRLQQRQSFRALISFAARDGAQQISAFIPSARATQVNLKSPTAISLSNEEIFAPLLPVPLLPKIMRDFDIPYFEFLSPSENNVVLVCQRLHRHIRLIVDDLVRLRDASLNSTVQLQAVADLLDQLLRELAELASTLGHLSESLASGNDAQRSNLGNV